jgi:hypothetical protein
MTAGLRQKPEQPLGRLRSRPGGCKPPQGTLGALPVFWFP